MVYFLSAVVLVAGIVGLSYVLGQRHRERATGRPYESGISPTGSARQRMDVKFYLVAMFFVIFDLEAAFIFAWAVALRELGWPGYFAMLIFVGVLAASLVYLWRVRALDWGVRRPGDLPTGRTLGARDAMVAEQTEPFFRRERS